MQAADWPDWVRPESRLHHSRLEQVAAHRSQSLLDCSLAFTRAQNELEAAVLGLCSQRELEEALQGWSQDPAWSTDEAKEWMMNDYSLLDPRRWPS